MLNFKKIRESLTPEDIKRTLLNYGVHSVDENDNAIIFPTACHGGDSNKLYYYKNTYFFRCYTECGQNFDIIELIRKLELQQGNSISFIDAAAKLGYEDEQIEQETNIFIQDREYQDFLLKRENFINAIERNIKPVDKEALNKFVYNEEYLEPWINEGINTNTLKLYEIKYDPIAVAIVIPHHNLNGEIIGVRGRFMKEGALSKYMPLSYQGKPLSHPLSSNLYGLYQNQKAIQTFKTVVIFEAEKSVLKMQSIYGSERNFSAATCGNKISNEQIELLRSIGVENVVLAFDKDYESGDYKELKEKYDRIAVKLSNYFNTSVMLDFGDLLGYKDSPIDKGKQIFEELFKYRYYI